MPEFEYVIEPILGDLKKGSIISNHSVEKDSEKVIHYAVKGVKDIVKDIYNIYKANKKKPTRKDFLKIFDKHGKKREDDITNFLDQLENEEELFKVTKRTKNKEGKITIELEKISNKERLKLVRSITEKLLKKIKPNHIKSIFEEMIKKQNDVEVLKRIDKKLNSKKELKVEGKKGCFKFVIGDEDLFMVR